MNRSAGLPRRFEQRRRREARRTAPSREPPDASVADRRHLIQLGVDELSAYRAAVIACAGRDESRTAERLLGQLASLEPRGPAVSRLQFVPAATSAPLALRALAHLRASR